MKEVKGMKEYEIIIETINPCGGDRHSQQEIVEAKIEKTFGSLSKKKEDFQSLIRLRIPTAGL